MSTALVLGVIIAVWVLATAVATALTTGESFQCPSGQAILLTVRRHDAALPVLARLTTAGVEASVAEETAKSFARRFLYRLIFIGYLADPPGPWHVLVPRVDLSQGKMCLQQREPQHQP